MPCVPDDWDEFTVTRKYRGTTYKIDIVNRSKKGGPVISLKINGESVDPKNVLPLLPGEVKVEVVI